MPRISTAGAEIEYEEYGPSSGIPLLLVMGLSGQLIDWPPMVISGLAERGFRVIIFDNRDSGLSSEITDARTPDLTAVMQGREQAPYFLSDLATDAFVLLDNLGIQEAHILGASMGGMVAQEMALAAPERVLSMVLAMTSAGNPFHGPAGQALLTLSPDHLARDTVIANNVLQFQASGSPAEQIVSKEVAVANAARRYDRSYRPAGTMRQVAAILGSPDRSRALTRLELPTLVLHGHDDPLIDVSHGRNLAALIPGATLVVAANRGHQLAWLAEPIYLEAISELSRVAEVSKNQRDR